jgi:hypothetical protein
MKRIFTYFVLILLVTVLGYAFVFAQLNDDERWQTDLHYEPLHLSYKSYSKSDFDNTVAKLKFIQSQNLIEQNDEWAGDYKMFGNLDVYIFRWMPNAGFVEISVYTCIPELRRLNYGSVTATPNYIITKSASTKAKEKDTKFVRVKWGEQRYLIQENRISDFYSYLAGYNNDGSDYIDEPYFWVHKDDVNKPFAGMPIFPAGYERFVKKPIKATVTGILRKEIKAIEFNENEVIRDDNGKVIPYYESHTYIKIDAGSSNGVKHGMGFNPLNSDSGGLRLKIVNVDKHSSTGVVVVQLGENKQETAGDIEILQMFNVGVKLSTSSIFQQLKN